MPAFFKKNPKKFLLIIAALLIGLSFPKTVYGFALLATAAAGAILIIAILIIQQFLVFAFSLLVTAFIMLVQMDLRELMGLGVGLAVDTVWRLVRDLSNMFFIVVMVMIAFATMLKLEQYKWQRLLPKLVIMAILINFSKTISLIILDFGQLLMMTFVRAFKDIAVDNLITGLKLNDMLSLTKGVSDLGGDIKLLIAPLLSIIMIAVATIVMLTLVVILLFRMAIIWILIAISPAAYLTNVLDATKQYWSKWWSFFIKTVFLGPSLGFFLWFVFLFMNGANNILPQDQLEKSLPGLNSSLAYGANAASSPLSFTNFLIAIVLLVVGTGMAISAAGASGKAAGAVKGLASGWTRGRISDWARKSEGKGLLRSTVGKLPLPGGFVGRKLGREYKGQTLADKMGPKKAFDQLAESWEGSPNKLKRFGSRMLKKKPIKALAGYAANSGRNPYDVGNYDVREEKQKDGTVKLVVTANDPGTFKTFQNIKDDTKNPKNLEELQKRFASGRGLTVVEKGKDNKDNEGRVSGIEFREKGRETPVERMTKDLHATRNVKGDDEEAEPKKTEEKSGELSATAPTTSQPATTPAPSSPTTPPTPSGSTPATLMDINKEKLDKSGVVYAARDAKKEIERQEGHTRQELTDKELGVMFDKRKESQPNNPLNEKVEAEVDRRRTKIAESSIGEMTDQQKQDKIKGLKGMDDIKAGEWYLQLDKNNPLRGEVDDKLGARLEEERTKRGRGDYQFSDDDGKATEGQKEKSVIGKIVKDILKGSVRGDDIDKVLQSEYKLNPETETEMRGKAFKHVVDTESQVSNDKIYNKKQYENLRAHKDTRRPEVDRDRVEGIDRILRAAERNKEVRDGYAGIDISQLSQQVKADLNISDDMAAFYLDSEEQIKKFLGAITSTFSHETNKSLGLLGRNLDQIAKQVKGLRVINKGREGYAPDYAMGHERIERKLALRRANQQAVTQVRMMQALNNMQNYKGASGEKAQEKLIQETRAQFNITGNSPEDNERATKEAFIGALLNSATHWGDKDGAKLSAEDVNEFRDLTKSE